MKKLLIVLLLAGCAAKPSYDVTSYPSGATVRIDGEMVGKTPLSYSSWCSTFMRPRIEVYKDTQNYIDTKLEYSPHIGNIVSQAFLFWPALFLAAECPQEKYYFYLPRDMK